MVLNFHLSLAAGAETIDGKLTIQQGKAPILGFLGGDPSDSIVFKFLHIAALHTDEVVMLFSNRAFKFVVFAPFRQF